MKSIFKVALALALFCCAPLASAQTRPTVAAKITKKWQLHDGCHSAHAKMIGRRCR